MNRHPLPPNIELWRARASRPFEATPLSQSKLHRSVGGFTLIELLVVIAIIAILAALVLSASHFVQIKGSRNRAEAEIAALGAALESYKADTGDYPTNPSTSSTNTLCLVTNLMPPIVNGVASGKVYYEFKPKSTNAAGYIDPFGSGYNYIYTNGSPNNGTNNYDLWSWGGLTNSPTNTWIKNW